MALDKEKLNMNDDDKAKAIAGLIMAQLLGSKSDPARDAHNSALRGLFVAVGHLQMMTEGPLKLVDGEHPAKKLDQQSLLVGFLTGKIASALDTMFQLETRSGVNQLLSNYAPEGLGLSMYIEEKCVDEIKKVEPMLRARVEQTPDARIKMYHPNHKGMDGKEDKSFFDMPTAKNKMN